MGNIITEDAILYTSVDSYERNKKEKEYLDYIANHINNVIKSFNLYFVPLLDKSNISTLVSDEDLKEGIRSVAANIETHDASKFSDSEFDAYRRKYYPTQNENNNADERYKQMMEDEYEKAWQHHYETNAHHPEHWRNQETKLCTDMTLDAIIEMICDWEAMSLRFGTSTLEWYENDAKDEKEALTRNTKDIVEDLLYNVLHK